MDFNLLTRTAAMVLAGALLCGPALAQKKDEKADQLGQFGDWGAYRASPGGKTVCFAFSKPTSAESEPKGRGRDASYAFVSTRPAEKVKNEVSVIVGYPQKGGVDAAVTVGSAHYNFYTQNDGAWVKNAAEEPKMVEAMKKAPSMIVKSESAHGTKTTDTYSLKGFAEALAKTDQACK
jgi:invasion protein IalB